MTESNHSMLLWIALVAGLAVFGCVALAGLGLVGGVFYATERAAPEDTLPPPLPSEPVALPPALPSEPTERPLVLPPCPLAHYRMVRTVRLTPTAFWIEATGGTSFELAYEGSAYPYAELQANLIRERRMAPNEAMNITAEPGVPSSVPARALGIARDVGYHNAIVCIARTPPAGVDESGGPGTALSGPVADERDRVASARRPRTARVRTGNPDVRGSLSREVVRRIVRRHTGDIRHCYESQLALHPGLEGRVTLSFIISPNGAVSSSTIGSSTLNSAGVESCITRAVRRWTFPAPQGGGVVGVNYPFVFSTG